MMTDWSVIIKQMPRVAASKREQYAADRAEHILEAALRVFSRRGFAEATMEEVAVEAGVAKGSLYLYFPSKDDLLDRLVHRGDLLPNLAELLARVRDLPPARGIPILVAELWRRLKERKELVYILVREVFGRPERARLFIEQVRMPAAQALADYLRLWMERGELRRADPIASAQCLFGMLWYFLQTQELAGEAGISRLPDAVLTRTVADIFLAGTVSARVRRASAPKRR